MINTNNYFDRACIHLGGLLAGNPRAFNGITGLTASILAGERMTSLHEKNSYISYTAQTFLYSGLAIFAMPLLSNALINRHRNHQFNRLIPNQMNMDQTLLTQVRYTLTSMPSVEREHFTNLVLSLQIREPEYIPFFSTIIASEPYNRRANLTNKLHTLLSNWTRNQLTVAEFVRETEFRNTNLQINLIHRLHTTISNEMSDVEMQHRLSIALEDQQPNDLLEIYQATISQNYPVDNGEQWTEDVADYVDEIHDDARLRQAVHEQSLAQDAPAKDFFHKTILDYLQSSTRKREELIEDYESYAPEIYLEIIKHAVIKAIASEAPLINRDGSSQELPFCLLSIGPELEILRKNKFQGNIEALASELQQKTSVQVAIQDAMNSVQESAEYQNWKM